jgi:hypothetical protein
MRTSQLQVMEENARAFLEISIEAINLHQKLAENADLQRNALLVVSATNMMFSIELMFKSFLLLTTGKFETGHKLYELYLKLPETTQKEITTLYQKLSSLAPVKVKPWALFTTVDGKEPSRKVWERYKPDLIPMLKAHDDGFVKWRYSHEIQQNPVLIFDYYNLRLLSSVIEMAMADEMSKYLKIMQKYN